MLFYTIVSAALLMPVLTEFVLAPSAAVGNYAPVPYRIAQWQGQDIKFTKRVVQIYGPMEEFRAAVVGKRPCRWWNWRHRSQEIRMVQLHV